MFEAKLMSTAPREIAHHYSGLIMDKTARRDIGVSWTALRNAHKGKLRAIQSPSFLFPLLSFLFAMNPFA